MLTKNVIYAERPDTVIVTPIAKTGRCYVEFPVNIREEPVEDGTQYICNLYTISRVLRPGLKEEVEANYEEWLEKAIIESEPELTVQDVMDAVNELAEIVLGGE